jgi:hypothetical protein
VSTAAAGGVPRSRRRKNAIEVYGVSGAVGGSAEKTAWLGWLARTREQPSSSPLKTYSTVRRRKPIRLTQFSRWARAPVLRAAGPRNPPPRFVLLGCWRSGRADRRAPGRDGTMTILLRRIAVVATAIGVVAACGGSDSESYSRAEIKDAFKAEGFVLADAGPELRPVLLTERGPEFREDYGFWMLVFDDQDDAENGGTIYEGQGTLGEPRVAYRLANVVVYATRDLDSRVADRIEAALGRLGTPADAAAVESRSWSADAT